MAAGQKAIRGGKVAIEIGVNDAFSKSLKAISGKLKSFGAGVAKIGAGLSAVGAAVTGPLLAATKVFSDQGDALAKMSKRTGIAVESLSQLEHAANLSGSNVGTLEKGVKKMQKTLIDAERGLSTATDAVSALGLNTQALLNLSPEDQFKAIADAIAKIEDPTRKAALAQEIFGRAGTQLLPLLNEGSKGIAAMQREAEEMGLTLSGPAAKSAEELNDNIGRLTSVFNALTRTIGGALAPAINKILTFVTPLISDLIKWVNANQQLIVTIAKIGAVISAAGVAFVTLGGAITGLGFAFSGLASIWGVIGGLATTVAGALAALVSPLGLVLAAVVGGAGAWVYYSDTASTALNWLKDQLASLKDFVGVVAGGISDALAAGDITLAAEVLWAGLRVVWEKGTLELRKVWENATGFFKGIFVDAFAVVLNFSQTIFHGLEVAWIETTAFLSSSWETFTTFMSDSWARVANFLEKTWNRIKGIFSSTFDAAAANLEADAALAAKLASNSGDKKAAQDAIEAQRAFKREQSAAVSDGTADVIAQAHIESIKAIEAEGQTAIDKAQAELDKANSALKEKAKQARDAKDSATSEGPKRPEIQQFSADLSAAGATTEKKITSVGSFNTAAIGQALAGGAPERTAKAAELTAKNTSRLITEVKRSGLKYA